MQKTVIKNKALEYYEIYRNKVLPIFNEFEDIRLDVLKRFKKEAFFKYLLPIIITFILLLMSLSVPFNIHDKNFNIKTYMLLTIIPKLLFFAAIIYLLPLYFVARKNENMIFNSGIKTKALQPLLKVFGDIKWSNSNIEDNNWKGNIALDDEDALDYNEPFDYTAELEEYEEKLKEEFALILKGIPVINGNSILKDEELYKSGLFLSYNERDIDDEFEGSYKGVSFRISETKMYEAHRSVRRNYGMCVFKGVILSFNFNKKINNRTLIATKGDFTIKNQTYITTLFCLPACLGIFNGGYAHWKLFVSIMMLVVTFLIVKSYEKKEESLNEVILEDSRFNKLFNVYSSDQVEARYLVTPSFMERFYNLKTAFGAKKAKCSFYEDKLMIAIQTNKNLFEVCSLFKSLHDPSSINEFYKELNSIYKIIEHFKLDEKIGV